MPKLLYESGRAPCYKKIAIQILKNDFNLFGLGFDKNESELSDQIYLESTTKHQSKLF